MDQKHISHIRKIDRTIQTNKEHMEGVRKIASLLGEKAGVQNLLQLAAVLHDMGKETEAFWHYIIKAVEADEHSERGKIDHAAAGAIFIFRKYHKGGRMERITAEILAIIIAYHHGGLGDFVDMQCRSEFLKRMSKNLEDLYYEESKENYFQVCYEQVELEELFSRAVKEIERITEQMKSIGLKEELMYGLLTKFAYSCLIDADRLDTYCFMQDVDVDRFLDRKPDWNGFSQLLEHKLVELSKETVLVDPKVVELRQQVSDECLAFARRPKGVYRLTVPTGGGKTFSVMRYGFAHAEHFRADHIFYIAPFLTILDQNVRDIREVLKIGPNDQDTLLEYHSNVLQSEKTEEQELLAERFEAPIIFTTLVQFLNSFYESGTKSIRRLHQFSNSILIFDEAQAVPFRCIHLFNAALNFLAEIGGSTIVLCTATQPELSKTAKPLMARNQGEIMGDVSALFEQLNRTEIKDCTKSGGYSIEELKDFVWEKAQLEGNALIILNKKKQVENLYRKIVDENSRLEEDRRFEVFHLSTFMCPQHRLDVLEEIKKCLAAKRRVICISTQLIEAGVNISFRCVVRALAGLDSVAQAAGRCNRHGEAGETKCVYLVNLSNEDLSKLREIERGKEHMIRILNEFKDDRDYFEGSLLSPKTIECYFEYFYSSDKMLMDFPIKNGLDNVSIMSLLSENRVCADAYEQNNDSPLDLECRQAHKTAAETFEVISSRTTSVLTYYGEGKNIIAALNGKCDLETMKSSLKRAQRYSVNLYSWEFEKLSLNGGIKELCDGAIFALVDGFYDKEKGVVLEGGVMEFLSIDGFEL